MRARNRQAVGRALVAAVAALLLIATGCTDSGLL
ncbi:MAG: hypothetical protein K0S98_2192, partial [Propionibacteriaceae bacterium]|nr:hypothetical protein [Propionibacteriaceae bacterium]